MTIDIPVSEERLDDLIRVAEGREEEGRNLGLGQIARELRKDALTALRDYKRLRTAQPKGDARLLTDEQIAEIRDTYGHSCRANQWDQEVADVINTLCDHYAQSAPSAQPKGESGVTGEQLDTLEAYVLDHEDANDEYTRNAVSAVRAAIGALRSPAACAASQETAGEQCSMCTDIAPCCPIHGRKHTLRLDESKAQMTEAWVEWKPGEPLPVDGLYYTTWAGAYGGLEQSLVLRPMYWERNGVIAYLPKPLPAPYQANV